jgi:hypothetical protein
VELRENEASGEFDDTRRRATLGLVVDQNECRDVMRQRFADQCGNLCARRQIRLSQAIKGQEA